ncbi:unnamed protein product [Adineta ricciae]|uniref:Uncharacterized protein n=1 Tax=Adineta ricciae TaxID=249248 RepID=A0A815UT27_ADIRI|nr:unnamed protein product [Adineta ricciae]CAF1621364.1 unnamed protein product [Adineta ricciae]
MDELSSIQRFQLIEISSVLPRPLSFNVTYTSVVNSSCLISIVVYNRFQSLFSFEVGLVIEIVDSILVIKVIDLIVVYKIIQNISTQTFDRSLRFNRISSSLLCL